MKPGATLCEGKNKIERREERIVYLKGEIRIMRDQISVMKGEVKKLKEGEVIIPSLEELF